MAVGENGVQAGVEKGRVNGVALGFQFQIVRKPDASQRFMTAMPELLNAAESAP